MISFFRKTRQKLLNDGKTARYFKYAIGEILLVVIGILIALQINNWNEQRKGNHKEQVILKSLKSSFFYNLNNLKQAKADTKKFYDNSLVLLQLIHPTEVNYSNEQVDKLVGTIINYYTYDPATGDIDELVNSGQLSMVQNNQLKKQLSNWSRLMTDMYKDINISNNHLFNFLVIHLAKYGNLKNIPLNKTILSRNQLSPIPKSNFAQDYSELMSSLEFENLLYWQSVNLSYIVNEYDKFQEYLETTIALLDSEIK